MQENLMNAPLSPNFNPNSSPSPTEHKMILSLSAEQLSECISNYRMFHSAVDHFNSEAILMLKGQEFEQALLLLNKAEKMINYAIQNGKTINKALLITILHNKACALQGRYDLTALSENLISLVKNLNLSFKITENIQHIEKDDFLGQDSRNHQILSYYVRNKKECALYYLHISSLNSKKFQHNKALKQAHLSIEIMKDICKHCKNYLKFHHKSEFYQNLLGQLALINSQLSKLNLHHYLKKVKKLLNSWQNCSGNEDIKNFSLGKIMQLLPLTLQQSQTLSSLEEECSEKEIYKKIFYIVAGFFTISSQLRLISATSKNNFRFSEEFELSEVYHIYSIYLVLSYIPFKTIFLKNLIISFSNHYRLDLENASKENTPTNHENTVEDSFFSKMDKNNVTASHQTKINSETKWERNFFVEILSKKQSLGGFRKITNKKLKLQKKKEIFKEFQTHGSISPHKEKSASLRRSRLKLLMGDTQNKKKKKSKSKQKVFSGYGLSELLKNKSLSKTRMVIKHQKRPLRELPVDRSQKSKAVLSIKKKGIK